MADLFKSAFEYFSNSAVPGVDNDFVGEIVEVGNVKLRIKRVIAEGRFSYFFMFWVYLNKEHVNMLKFVDKLGVSRLVVKYYLISAISWQVVAGCFDMAFRWICVRIRRARYKHKQGICTQGT